ncbi:roundabout homolog 4 isoform X3 [Struthio camelus]|uniref:roundabout homolog 4 isoform X3 n=1 Tax=Struthio camelus TaxID=8801 RepID=UPI0036042767
MHALRAAGRSSRERRAPPRPPGTPNQSRSRRRAPSGRRGPQGAPRQGSHCPGPSKLFASILALPAPASGYCHRAGEPARGVARRGVSLRVAFKPSFNSGQASGVPQQVGADPARFLGDPQGIWGRQTDAAEGRLSSGCPWPGSAPGRARIRPRGSGRKQEGCQPQAGEAAPHIVEHPADLAAPGDQPATLRCRVAGVPAPVVTWYRDGQPVGANRGDPGSPRTLLPGGSLFFLRLDRRADEGVYTCVATNRLGTATSRNATLSVAALRENFRLQPGDLVATAGQALELHCVPPSGHPEPDVTWRKDGVALDLATGRYEVSRGKLRVAQARRSDSGAYVCVATNAAGERESRPALVSVLEKPAIVQPPSDTAAVAGSTVELVCGTQGDPLPWVQWHKERGDLPWGRHEVDREHTLRLYAVSPADSGTYVCTAQSQLGTVAATAVLRVEDLPETDRQEAVPQDLLAVRLHLDNSTTLPSAAAVQLHWRVLTPAPAPEGYTVLYRCLLPASTTWAQHDVGRELSAIIPALKRGYKYEFKVRPYARGAQGLDSNTRHLWIPEEAPSAAPQHVTVGQAEMGNGTVVVSWEPPPPDAHNGIIRGYKVWSLGNGSHHHTNRTVDGGTHRLETFLLGPGATYCIQVAAFNGAGLGVPSNATCGILEPLLEVMARGPEALPLAAIIAGAGALLWVTLLAFLVYLCQRRASSPHGKGLCHCTSEDTVARQRLDAGDSPWLSDTWKSTSGSKTLGSSSSLSSHLLWSDTTLTLEQPSRSAPVPPDPSTLRGDLPPAEARSCPDPPSHHGGQPGLAAREQGGDPNLPPAFSSPKLQHCSASLGSPGPGGPPRAWHPPARSPGPAGGGRLSPSPSLSDDGDSVLTPERVAESLERAEDAPSQPPNAGRRGGSGPRREPSLRSPPRPFSPPHTYGYICGPPASELGDPEEEEEEEEEERTAAGSLLNGWGSVSEENFASARCSLVSSSDGSFLADADFARALALAVDSLCFSLGRDDDDGGLYTAGFSPPSSPSEGLLFLEGPPQPSWGWMAGLEAESGWRAKPEEDEAAPSPAWALPHPWHGSHGLVAGSPWAMPSLGAPHAVAGPRRERSRGTPVRRM